MNNEKEEWIEDIFYSMKDSERAKPDEALFSRIEDKISGLSAKVIPMHRLKYIAAASVFLFVFNAYVLFQSEKDDFAEKGEISTAEASNASLISNYNIYE